MGHCLPTSRQEQSVALDTNPHDCQKRRTVQLDRCYNHNCWREQWTEHAHILCVLILDSGVFTIQKLMWRAQSPGWNSAILQTCRKVFVQMAGVSLAGSRRTLVTNTLTKFQIKDLLLSIQYTVYGHCQVFSKKAVSMKLI